MNKEMSSTGIPDFSCNPVCITKPNSTNNYLKAAVSDIDSVFTLNCDEDFERFELPSYNNIFSTNNILDGPITSTYKTLGTNPHNDESVCGQNRIHCVKQELSGNNRPITKNKKIVPFTSNEKHNTSFQPCISDKLYLSPTNKHHMFSRHKKSHDVLDDTEGTRIDLQLKHPEVPRKFPGPAGALSLKISRDIVPNVDIDLQSGGDLKKQNPHLIQSITDDQWSRLRNDLGDDSSYYLEEFSIAKCLYHASTKQLVHGKFPLMFVEIISLDRHGDEGSAIAMDKSGKVPASIHRDVFNDDLDICVGCILVLKQVGIISPTLRHHYLNITLSNIMHCYPATKNMTLAQNIDKMLRHVKELASISSQNSDTVNFVTGEVQLHQNFQPYRNGLNNRNMLFHLTPKSPDSILTKSCLNLSPDVITGLKYEPAGKFIPQLGVNIKSPDSIDNTNSQILSKAVCDDLIYSRIRVTGTAKRQDTVNRHLPTESSSSQNFTVQKRTFSDAFNDDDFDDFFNLSANVSKPTFNQSAAKSSECFINANIANNKSHSLHERDSLDRVTSMSLSPKYSHCANPNSTIPPQHTASASVRHPLQINTSLNCTNPWYSSHANTESNTPKPFQLLKDFVVQPILNNDINDNVHKNSTYSSQEVYKDLWEDDFMDI